MFQRFRSVGFVLNRSKFNHIVAKYDGDKYVKHFTCWNQLPALVFGQLSVRTEAANLPPDVNGAFSLQLHLAGTFIMKNS